MNTRKAIMVRMASFAGAGALALAASAQTCGPHWLPGDGIPGMNGGTIRAVTTWDPDGPGGQDPLTVVAGSFTATPAGPASRIAAWDRATNTWSTFGSGLANGVEALAVMPNGDLVAAGSFTTAGGSPASRIARWDGKTWSPFGSGMSNTVRALAVMPNGDLIAGGLFTTAGGTTVNKIARWDGSQWNAMDGGMTRPSDEVHALCVLASGDLLVGGGFINPGGYSFAYAVARWDGTWHSVAVGIASGACNAIVETPGGDVYIGGSFSAGSGVTRGVARLNDDGAWYPLGLGVMADDFPADYVNSLCVLPDGSILVGGDFTSINGTSIPAVGIGRWDGTAWHAAGVSGLATGGLVSKVKVRAMAVMPDGDAFIGGDFGAADNIPAYYGATYDTGADALSPLALGMNGVVKAMTFDPDGDLIIGGAFTGVHGVAAPRVARWDGASWSPMGAGFNNNVEVLFTASDSTIYAGGRMTMSGDEFLGFVAKWTGTEWFRVGTTAFVSGGPGNGVKALTELPSGDLVAGGQFSLLDNTALPNIARFDGVQWNAMGDGLNGDVWTLITMPNGDAVAGGAFSSSGALPVGKLARWNGTSWSSMGVTTGIVYASVLMPNGDLIVGGSFTNLAGIPEADRIARWNGTTWSALGTGMSGGSLSAVQDLIVLPNGDLLAIGSFTSAGDTPVSNIARWNGSAWSDYYAPGLSGTGYVARTLPNGELAVGAATHQFIRWTDTGVPAVAINPEPQSDDSGGTIVLNAAVAPGYVGVSVQWQRNGVDIVDGPGGASAGGGTVSGATDALASPTDGSTVSLTITDAQSSDSGEYLAVFSNTCGEVQTAIASITITGGAKCPADFDNNGTVNSTDVGEFINAWFQDQVDGTFISDWDDNGIVNSTDVGEFINAWFEDIAAGCGS